MRGPSWAKRQDAKRVAQKREEVIPDKFYQRTAKVVFIIEKKHSRACTGHLKKQSSKVLGHSFEMLKHFMASHPFSK